MTEPASTPDQLSSFAYLRRRVRRETAPPERDFIEVKLKDFLLGQHAFNAAGKDHFLQLARDGIFIAQKQVLGDLLLGDEYSVTRKLKEMILAGRIEGVLTKQEILELYLNEIPLGRRSFAAHAAAQIGEARKLVGSGSRLGH